MGSGIRLCIASWLKMVYLRVATCQDYAFEKSLNPLRPLGYSKLHVNEVCTDRL